MGWYDAQSDRLVSGSRDKFMSGSSDKFVSGSSDGHDMTAEEQLAIKGTGSMAAKGAEWGLLQLDLSFAWQLRDKPDEDVREMLEQAEAVV